MSSYHILEAQGDDEGNVNYRVAMHIATPAGNNLAATSYVNCLVQDSQAVKTSIVAGISASESAALAAGTLVEHIYSFEINPGRPNADKQNILDQKYRDMVTLIQNRIKRRYWGWGYSRDVV